MKPIYSKNDRVTVNPLGYIICLQNKLDSTAAFFKLPWLTSLFLLFIIDTFYVIETTSANTCISAKYMDEIFFKVLS